MGIPTSESVLVYRYENGGEILHIDLWENHHFYPDFETKYFDEEERLIEHIFNYSDIGKERYLHSFYSDGKPQTNGYYSFDYWLNGWQLYEQDSFTYHREYDAEGLLTYLHDERYSVGKYDTSIYVQDFHSTYYCDGLLKYEDSHWGAERYLDIQKVQIVSVPRITRYKYLFPPIQ